MDCNELSETCGKLQPTPSIATPSSKSTFHSVFLEPSPKSDAFPTGDQYTFLSIPPSTSAFNGASNIPELPSSPTAISSRQSAQSSLPLHSSLSLNKKELPSTVKHLESSLSLSPSPLSSQSDCQAQYQKADGPNRDACFFDNPKTFDELVFTDRDPNSVLYSGKLIDWKNWKTYLLELICRCAIATQKKGGALFGLQYYGECWLSRKANTYNSSGLKRREDSCINFDFKPCKDTDLYCVGTGNHSFVYKLYHSSTTQESRGQLFSSTARTNSTVFVLSSSKHTVRHSSGNQRKVSVEETDLRLALSTPTAGLLSSSSLGWHLTASGGELQPTPSIGTPSSASTFRSVFVEPSPVSHSFPTDCEAQYQKVDGPSRDACFFDNPKTLDELVFTDRDPNSVVYSGRLIDWKNWKTYLLELICRCATDTQKKGGTLFGLQYYGECWLSRKANAYNSSGLKRREDSCVNFDFKPCKDTDLYCVGTGNHNYVYKLLTSSTIQVQESEEQHFSATARTNSTVFVVTASKHIVRHPSDNQREESVDQTDLRLPLSHPTAGLVLSNSLGWHPTASGDQHTFLSVPISTSAFNSASNIHELPSSSTVILSPQPTQSTLPLHSTISLNENEIPSTVNHLESSLSPIHSPLSSRSGCSVHYEKVDNQSSNACFYAKPNPFTELVFTDRDTGSRVFSGEHIDWNNWNTYIKNLICRCALETKKLGKTIFGLQFYGECWTSSDLDSFNKNGPKQNKNGCKSFDHKECKDTDLYCVGAEDHSYVYKLI